MFSQACVKNSVHGGGGRGLGTQHALGQTPSLPSAGMLGYTHTPGQTPPTPGRPSMGRHPPQADILPPTATAADGTHPTGMHSCVQ